MFNVLGVLGVFTVNFEHISHLVLVFLLLTLSRQMPAKPNSKLMKLFLTYAYFVECSIINICDLNFSYQMT